MIDISTKSYGVESDGVRYGARSISIDTDNSSYRREIMIHNYSAQEVWAIDYDGTLFAIAPMYRVDTPSGKIVITSRWSYGILPPDTYPIPGNRTTQYNTSSTDPEIVSTVFINQLEIEPAYCAELKMAFCLKKDIDVMKSRYCTSEEQIEKIVRKTIIDRTMEGGNMSPFNFYANTSNADINNLYMIVNNGIYRVVVQHDKEMPEGLTMYSYRNGKVIPLEIGFNWKDKNNIVTERIHNQCWYFSTDASLLQNKLNEIIKAGNDKYTIEEVESKIAEKVESLKQELNEKDKQIALLKDQNRHEKDKAMLANGQLQLANDPERLSNDQELYRMQLLKSVLEQDTARLKKDTQTEQIHEDVRHQEVTNKHDEKMAEARVRKEELSVTGAEVSNVGTFAKTAAVVVPIAAAASIFVVSHMTPASIVAHLAGITNLSEKALAVKGILMKVISNGAKISSSVFDCLVNVAKQAAEYVSDIPELVVKVSRLAMNISSNTISTIKSFMGSFWNNFTSMLGNIGSALCSIGAGIWNGVCELASDVGSIMKNIVNGICDGFRSVCGFVSSLFS